MNRALRTLARCAAAAALAAPLAAFPQAYPSKPIRLVTEFIGGSGGDSLLRIIMAPMSESMGQPIVVDSHAGAGGLVAAELVARSEPDGYTLLAGAPNVHTVRPYLSRANPFDSLKELTPITPVAEPFMAIVVNPVVPAKNLKELIDYARSRPGKVAYATSGIGSTFHLDAELIQMMTGIKLVQVPYKALQQAMADVVAGQPPVSFALAGMVRGQVAEGKLRPIAMVGNERYSLWPNVAPISETIPDFETPAAWTALFGPAKLPAPLVQRLYSEVTKSLDNPAVKAKLASIGVEPRSMPPEQFAGHIRRQKELVGRIVKAAGIKPVD